MKLIRVWLIDFTDHNCSKWSSGEAIPEPLNDLNVCVGFVGEALHQHGDSGDGLSQKLFIILYFILYMH